MRRRPSSASGVTVKARTLKTVEEALSAWRFGLWSARLALARGRLMPPLSLSDEELSLLRSLAEPVAYGRRGEFLQEVAAALRACPQPGPGAIYRIARDVQRRYVLTSQRVAAGENAAGLAGVRQGP
jgi:hypothetical protein